MLRLWCGGQHFSDPSHPSAPPVSIPPLIFFGRNHKHVTGERFDTQALTQSQWERTVIPSTETSVLVGHRLVLGLSAGVTGDFAHDAAIRSEYDTLLEALNQPW